MVKLDSLIKLVGFLCILGFLGFVIVKVEGCMQELEEAEREAGFLAERLMGKLKISYDQAESLVSQLEISYDQADRLIDRSGFYEAERLVSQLGVSYDQAESLISQSDKKWRFLKIADTTTMAVGDQEVIPDWEWVNVVNKFPVMQHFRNYGTPLAAGETCGVEAGGVITVREIQGDKLLLDYTAPGQPLGTRCPSGIQYFISRDDFYVMRGMRMETHRLGNNLLLYSIALRASDSAARQIMMTTADYNKAESVKNDVMNSYASALPN